MASKIKYSGKQPKDIESALKRAAGIALQEVVPELDREFTVQIQSVVWGWPKKTLRKNKREAGKIRDIVDLGDLQRSQQNQKIGNYTWQWTWNVDYSAIVHDGGVLKDGRTKYPDRKWTKSAERVVDPQKSISDTLRRELNG